MWTLAFKLYADDPDKYSKTQDIQMYFEKIFEDLDNKPLQAPPSNYTALPSNMQPEVMPQKVNSQLTKKIDKL